MAGRWNSTKGLHVAGNGTWFENGTIAVNVSSLCREYDGDTAPPDTVALLSLMAELKRDRR